MKSESSRSNVDVAGGVGDFMYTAVGWERLSRSIRGMTPSSHCIESCLIGKCLVDPRVLPRVCRVPRGEQWFGGEREDERQKA